MANVLVVQEMGMKENVVLMVIQQSENEVSSKTYEQMDTFASSMVGKNQNSVTLELTWVSSCPSPIPIKKLTSTNPK